MLKSVKAERSLKSNDTYILSVARKVLFYASVLSQSSHYSSSYDTVFGVMKSSSVYLIDLSVRHAGISY